MIDKFDAIKMNQRTFVEAYYAEGGPVVLRHYNRHERMMYRSIPATNDGRCKPPCLYGME